MQNADKNFSQVATTPLEQGLPPYVYSANTIVSPFSFYDPQSLQQKGPIKPKEYPQSPCYIPLQELNVPKSKDPKVILNDFTLEKDGNLKLTNEELVKCQKGILTYVLKKAATKIFEGKSIVGLSLPVRIFEARSTIERLSDIWAYAPHYLTEAAGSGEGVDRIRAVMAFVAASLPHCLSQWKPFNPLLGETFQGVLDDGTTIDCEHTSHHPPITTMYINSKHWKAYGSWTYNGDLKATGNSLSAYNEGWITIEFNDGHKVEFFLPSMNIKGMMMGSRRC
jgi:Oxysterol-binding protein